MRTFSERRLPGADRAMPTSRGRKGKSRKPHTQAAHQTLPQEARRKRFLLTPVKKIVAAVVAIIGFLAAALAIVVAYAETVPIVTPQGNGSSLGSLHFLVADPSVVFDLRDVKLTCAVMGADTGPVKAGEPFHVPPPVQSVSREKDVRISYQHPVDFPCGTAPNIFERQSGTVAVPQPTFRVTILVDYSIGPLKQDRFLAGPFTAERNSEGRYEWVTGRGVMNGPFDTPLPPRPGQPR